MKITKERTLLEEGYAAMAEEHKRFAELTAQAAAEVVPAWEHSAKRETGT